MSETILLVEIPDPPSVPDHHGMRNLGARTHQRDIAHEEPHAMIIDCPAPAKRRQPLFLTNGQCVDRNAVLLKGTNLRMSTVPVAPPSGLSRIVPAVLLLSRRAP